MSVCVCEISVWWQNGKLFLDSMTHVALFISVLGFVDSRNVANIRKLDKDENVMI